MLNFNKISVLFEYLYKFKLNNIIVAIFLSKNINFRNLTQTGYLYNLYTYYVIIFLTVIIKLINIQRSYISIMFFFLLKMITNLLSTNTIISDILINCQYKLSLGIEVDITALLHSELFFGNQRYIDIKYKRTIQKCTRFFFI
jgi:hypothetical protein